MRNLKKYVLLCSLLGLCGLSPIAAFASSCVQVKTINNLIEDNIKLTGTSCDGSHYQKTIYYGDSSSHSYQAGSYMTIIETVGKKHLFSGNLGENGTITCNPGFPASCQYK